LRTAGEGTTPVAQLQHPANCRRYRTRATADVQGFTIAGHGYQPAITSHPPKRFRGNVGTVFQGGREHAVRRQRILVDTDGYLEAVSAIARRHSACQIVLGQRDHAIGSGRPLRRLGRLFRRFRGNIQLLAVLDFASPLDRPHHQVRLVRAQDDLQLYHSARKQAPPHRPRLRRGSLVGHLGVSEATTDSLQLCACRIERHLEQFRLIV
jgi:hypothetical protein